MKKRKYSPMRRNGKWIKLVPEQEFGFSFQLLWSTEGEAGRSDAELSYLVMDE